MPSLAPSEICPCGNYMPRPRLGPDGIRRCSACHQVLTTPVLASTRLTLRGRREGVDPR